MDDEINKITEYPSDEEHSIKDEFNKLTTINLEDIIKEA